MTILYISHTPGANAEIEALKKVVALAENKAAAEQALREKHEARVVEAERELQEAVGRSEILEHILSLKESELAQALRTTNEAREEAQAARLVSFFLFKAPFSFAGKIHGD